MPTASPSIIARVGALSLTPRKEAAPIMAAIVPTTPRAAVSSGSPAATSEPNVIMRMTRATPMPISSVGPMGAVDSA